MDLGGGGGGGVASYGEEGGGQTEKEQQEEHTANCQAQYFSTSNLKSLAISLRTLFSVFSALLAEVPTVFHSLLFARTTECFCHCSCINFI